MNANKKKLVILSVNYEPYMSGAEQMVREILEKLGDRYETTLLTASQSKSQTSFLSKTSPSKSPVAVLVPKRISAS